MVIDLFKFSTFLGLILIIYILLGNHPFPQYFQIWLAIKLNRILSPNNYKFTVVLSSHFLFCIFLPPLFFLNLVHRSLYILLVFFKQPVFFFLMFIYFWEREREKERERECKLGRGRERGRYRIWSRLQTLSCQQQRPTWGSNPQTMRSWHELKSDA